MSQHQSSSSSSSARQTISEVVETYKTFRRSDDPQAEALLPILKSRLRTEPVNELDVQAIWSFATPEWVEALFHNIEKFNIFNSQPAGGYIEMFIETEMLNCHERACHNIVAMYERQKRVVVTAAAARKAGPGLVHRATSRMADNVVEDTSYPSTMEHLVDALFMAWPYHQPEEIALLFYLHPNGATLTDVGALIAVLSKLADNIGCYYTRSSTLTNPSSELEAIFGHILARGDGQHQTYEMAKMHLQWYKNQLCQDDSQCRLRVLDENLARKQYLKILEWDTELTRKDIPTPTAQIRMKAFKDTLQFLRLALPFLFPRGRTSLASGFTTNRA
jgi:hypothetical protein